MAPPHRSGSEDDPALPTAWLHLKIGQILAGLDDVRGTMTEMRSDVGQLRESHQEVRHTVSGLISRIDSATERLHDVEIDVDALRPLDKRLDQIERDVGYLKPIVQRIDSLRTKLMGAVLLICSIGFILELTRNAWSVITGVPH